ncbi:hypothetical protein DQ04_00091180 [Trypanosoma grayi]|uniref:hypothetical protein n=1 Tax=Trypanosoma grayi TaxID=71804 RepID=UPI0004F43C6A|nr:hypothetical protein DQ04_00091180 [Trypanosoma grayi]KEG15384.1 hypothetical protein DQ04_00091180 [Trypanosoma grayi]
MKTVALAPSLGPQEGLQQQHTESPPPPKRIKSTTSPFLRAQQDLQKELHCDYVLLWYERDPESPPGQRPNFLRVGEPIPVSLSHQVFMQMALGVLKDRLVKGPMRTKSGNASKAAEKEGVSDNDTALKDTECQSPNAPGVPPKKVKNAPNRRQQDTVALFCFLWQYAVGMLKSQEEAMQLALARNKAGPPLRPVVRMTKQQLRLQMLLEYDIDVRQVLGDGLPLENAVTDEYCRGLLPENVGEEEFYNQLAKPSGMAQTCSVM